MSIVAVFAVLLGVVPGAVLVVVGVVLLRRGRNVHRVPVEARLVSRTSFRTPTSVTFDYPAPDGGWLRATRVEGAFSAVRGPWRWVPGTTVWRPVPGAPMTVWVDPANPHDVSLGELTSAGTFLGVAMTVFGTAMALAGLTFGLSVAAV